MSGSGPPAHDDTNAYYAAEVQSVLRPEIRSHVLCKPGRNNNRCAFPPALVVRPLDADPALKSTYEAWSVSRADFNVRLAALEPAAVAEGWQRHYLRGETPTGERPDFHVSRRKLRMPRLDKER